jgi:hypothetical protein
MCDYWVMSEEVQVCIDPFAILAYAENDSHERTLSA